MSIDECQELKNIKYKTSLLNGNKKSLSSVINDISNLDILLDEENKQSKKESWNRLDKSVKMNKINEYIKSLGRLHKLNVSEIKTLREYLSINLDKKNLQKNKDVIYIKESGKLENIPSLHFNNSTRKFSLKKPAQQSALKSLGPTRKKKSKPNKGNNTIESKLSKPHKSNKVDKNEKE